MGGDPTNMENLGDATKQGTRETPKRVTTNHRGRGKNLKDETLPPRGHLTKGVILKNQTQKKPGEGEEKRNEKKRTRES